MARPWTWTLTDEGEVHATAATAWLPGDEVGTICGDVLVMGAALVEVRQTSPCLYCLQTVSTLAALGGCQCDERAGAR